MHRHIGRCTVGGRAEIALPRCGGGGGVQKLNSRCAPAPGSAPLRREIKTGSGGRKRRMLTDGSISTACMLCCAPGLSDYWNRERVPMATDVVLVVEVVVIRFSMY